MLGRNTVEGFIGVQRALRIGEGWNMRRNELRNVGVWDSLESPDGLSALVCSEMKVTVAWSLVAQEVVMVHVFYNLTTLHTLRRLHRAFVFSC